MDSAFPIRIPYGQIDDIADLLEELAQLDVGEVTEHKAHLLGSAQNMSVTVRALIRDQTRCLKHVWTKLPRCLQTRYFPDSEQFCKLCGDLK